MFAVSQVAAVRLMHNVLGGTIDPHAAWMVLRGLKTLNLRVKQQNTSAMLLARRLEAHSKIAAVHYPGVTAAAATTAVWHPAPSRRLTRH